MNRICRLGVLTAGFLAAWAWCLSALAEGRGVSLTPIVLEIDKPRRVATLTVANHTDTPLRLQSQVRLWRQDSGVDVHGETADLAVVPAMATVPPNGKQVFRVALRQRQSSDVERAYRLILEDIGGDPANAGGVSFRFTHDLPVLVAPSAVRSSVQWTSCEQEPSHGKNPHASTSTALPCIRIVNTGNHRLRVAGLVLNGQSSERVINLPAPVSVLAGAWRELRLPPEAADAGAVQGAQVVTVGGESLQAQRSPTQAAAR